MNPVPLLADIWTGLRAQPARTALSASGIGIGVLALTVLLTVVLGLRDRARRITDELGAAVFGLSAVRAPGPEATARGGLGAAHAELLAANLPGAAVTGVRTTVLASDAGPLRVLATDPDWLRVRPARLTAGRFLDRLDLAAAAPHAVVSAALAREAALQPESAVRLGSRTYTVVGIVEGGGADPSADAPGAAGERFVLVPRSAPPEPEPPETGGNGRLDAVYVRAPDAARLPATLRTARRLLEAPEWRVAHADWITAERLVAGLTRLQRLIGATAGSIALLCLLSGGATLMGLMLANVRDRVPEIGLRRAMGARPRDIAALFVVEGVVLAVGAALPATLAAELLMRAVRGGMPVPMDFRWAAVLVPVLVAALAGLVFSWLPALRAARLDPSEALRSA